MIFTQLIDQFMPVFCEQRTLYEARERPAKTYSWKAFILASIVVESTWNSVRRMRRSLGLQTSLTRMLDLSSLLLHSLVLPYWSLSQCRMDGPGPQSRYYHLSPCLATLPLHDQLRARNDCRTTERGDSRGNSQPPDDYDVRFLRVSTSRTICCLSTCGIV